MKKITYIAAAALIIGSMIPLSTMDVLAGGENIEVSVDKTNAMVGESVTVTVTAYSDMTIAAGGYKVYVNGKYLGEADYNDGASMVNSFSFPVDAAGNYAVTLGPLEDTSTGSVELIPFDEASNTFQPAVPLNPGTVNVTAAMPTPTPEPTPTPAPTPTEAPAPTPTEAPVPTETPAPTETPTPAPTEAPAPTPTEAPTTPAAAINHIEVSYVGGEKKAGDTLSGIELSVLAVYDDGTSQPVSGWSCDQVGQPLKEGENIFTIKYEGFSTELTINAVSDGETTDESSEESTGETTGEESTEETGETETTTSEKIPYIQVVSPFGGDDLYLASDWSVNAPDGFEEDSITYAGYSVKVVKNEKGLTLAYMTDKEGNNGEFYIYDSDSQKFSHYTGIPVSENTFYILSVPEGFDDTGLTKMSLSINGKTFNAYQLSDSQAEGIVCLVYAMDAEGNKGFYRFDTELKTFVRYYVDRVAAETKPDAEEGSSGDASNADIKQQYEELAERYMSESWLKFYIIIALIVLSVILFIFVIVLAMKLKKIYNEYDFIDDEEDDEESEEDDEEDDEEIIENEDAEAEDSYIDEDFRVDLSGIADEDDEEQ